MISDRRQWEQGSQDCARECTCAQHGIRAPKIAAETSSFV